MTAATVLLIALAALAALLLTPAAVRVTLFDGQPRVTLRYLFVQFVLPPEKPARPKRKKKKASPREKKSAPPKPKKEKPEREWTSQSVRAVIELVKGLLRAAGRSGSFLLRGVRLRELKLEVCVVGGDACETAVRAGELCAVVHGGAALLQNYVKIGYLYLNIYPGFWARHESVAFEMLFLVSPLRVLASGVSLLAGGMGPFTAFLRSAKAEPAAPAAEKAPAPAEKA